MGILTAEIGDHVVSLFLEPFLRHYNRQHLEVELIEVTEHATAWADQLRGLADAVIPLGDVDGQEARRRLRSRGYHVLVETSGFTAHSGLDLLAERCAPVQCHYIGFHASTGLDTIDWFIGDEVTAAPELADHYVEGLWRLPRLWLASRRRRSCPRPPPPWTPPPRRCWARSTSSARWGRKPWISGPRPCAQPPQRAAPQERLQRCRRPPPAHPEGLERRGVDPARVRVLERTAGFAEHLGCYRGMDIALDATPWAGATTSFEALAMGVRGGHPGRHHGGPHDLLDSSCPGPGRLDRPRSLPVRRDRGPARSQVAQLRAADQPCSSGCWRVPCSTVRILPTSLSGLLRHGPPRGLIGPAGCVGSQQSLSLFTCHGLPQGGPCALHSISKSLPIAMAASTYRQRLLLQLLNSRGIDRSAAQGFTLIELLVVIVILGVLGGVATAPM